MNRYNKGKRGRYPKKSKRRGRGNTQNKIQEMVVFGPKVIHFDSESTLVCQIPRTIAPKSIMMRLTFPDTTNLRFKTTSPVTNWSIRGSAYDPDPSFGTGAIPGFVEYAALYLNHRCHGIGVRGSIANAEGGPVLIGFIPGSTTILSNNSFTTIINAEEYTSNSLAWSTTMSTSSGNKGVVRVNKFWNLTDILGSTQWLTDDGYAGAVSGNPSNSVWILAVASTLSGTNFATGIYTMLYYDMDIEFFARKQLLA